MLLLKNGTLTFLYVSTFQCAGTSTEQDNQRQSRMCVNCTHLASTTLVSSTIEDDLRTVIHCTKVPDHIVDANGQKQASSIDKDVLGMFSTVRELLQGRGISKDAIDTITNSWRESTRRQYWTYIKKWMLFCDRNESDPLDPPAEKVVNFLQSLLNNNLGYCAINTARSAISSLLFIE